jgi:hypothetical protein
VSVCVVVDALTQTAGETAAVDGFPSHFFLFLRLRGHCVLSTTLRPQTTTAQPAMQLFFDHQLHFYLHYILSKSVDIVAKFVVSIMSAVSLYTPYRAIGYVTDGNPFVVNTLGTENFVTLSIGNSFQVMKSDRLTTCLVSEQVPSFSGPIACLQAVGHETYVGVGSDILVYHRTRVVRTYANLSEDSPVKGMMIVGKTLFAYYDNNFIQVCYD